MDDRDTTTKPRPSRTLRVFVTPDGCEHVIARGEADAFRCREEQTGEPRDTWAGDYWRALDPDEKLAIWCDEGNGSIAEILEPGAAPLELTAKEWIKRQGRGWLCSTEGS